MDQKYLRITLTNGGLDKPELGLVFCDGCCGNKAMRPLRTVCPAGSVLIVHVVR